MIDPTQLTPEEIQQYRQQLKDNVEAITQLDVIEQCGGNLERAARVLARRADIEETRVTTTWKSALNRARQVVCNDNFKEGLAPDLIVGIVSALIASSDPLLIAVATPCASYIIKVTFTEFCKISDTD